MKKKAKKLASAWAKKHGHCGKMADILSGREAAEKVIAAKKAAKEKAAKKKAAAKAKAAQAAEKKVKKQPVKVQIKATHGKCLDASQRNRTGGKVHMWNCNTANKNQHWTYTKATGQIKATHGKCLDASQRNRTGGKVHMWNCNTANKNQHWTLTPRRL